MKEVRVKFKIIDHIFKVKVNLKFFFPLRGLQFGSVKRFRSCFRVKVNEGVDVN